MEGKGPCVHHKALSLRASLGTRTSCQEGAGHRCDLFTEKQVLLPTAPLLTETKFPLSTGSSLVVWKGPCARVRT